MNTEPVPILEEPQPAAAFSSQTRWRRALGLILAGNPFFVLSPVFLIYGLYRVSTDPGLFRSELRQLSFNFGSLHVYETALLGATFYLLRRRIRYDAHLLLFIENSLLFVPFILISQAAFLSYSAAAFISALGCLLVIVKIGCVSGMDKELFPRRILFLAAPFLISNLVLPLALRNRLTVNNEAFAVFHLWSWNMVLPGLAVALNFLIFRGREARPRWFALGSASMSLAVTSVHFRSLLYVDDRAFRVGMLAPVLFCLSWTALRLERWVLNRHFRSILWLLPAVANALAAVEPTGRLLAVLSILNVILYALFLRRDPICWFGFSEAAALFAYSISWPASTLYAPGAHFGMILFVVLGMIRLSRPAATFLGTFVVWQLLRQTIHWTPMLEISLLHAVSVVGLLHSLLWKTDWKEADAVRFLFLMGLWWTSFDLVKSGASAVSASLLSGVVVGAVYGGFALITGRRPGVIAPITAAGLILFPTGIRTTKMVAGIPYGISAIVGAFVFLLLGIAFAQFRISSRSRVPTAEAKPDDPR